MFLKSKHVLCYQYSLCADKAPVQVSDKPDKNATISQKYNNALKAELKIWLIATQSKVITDSLICKALNYTLNQWDKFYHYIEAGEFDIDNNITEQYIRFI
ncbi:transposase [Pseudoalteromonas sp. NBT06-2]|uniref:IS66 family transposase n=1 Tax=Pseudoalteromonas sp. NBT06-2 TaxID=2025950 RepID=UPI001482BFE8|nr:transposase [Pseudoalteromonas sp. NBT06-2]